MWSVFYWLRNGNILVNLLMDIRVPDKAGDCASLRLAVSVATVRKKSLACSSQYLQSYWPAPTLCEWAQERGNPPATSDSKTKPPCASFELATRWRLLLN